MTLPKQLQVKAKAKTKDFSTLTSTSTLLIPAAGATAAFSGKGFKEAKIKDPLLRKPILFFKPPKRQGFLSNGVNKNP